MEIGGRAKVWESPNGGRRLLWTVVREGDDMAVEDVLVAGSRHQLDDGPIEPHG